MNFTATDRRATGFFDVGKEDEEKNEKKRTACLIQELKRLTDRRNFHKILSSFDSNNIR